MEDISRVYMLSESDKIDSVMIKRINRSGFSKIPVFKDFDKNVVVGVLKVKLLVDY